jgi:hypothetical protein
MTFVHALARLTPDQRRAIQLRHLDGYPRDAAARAMGRSVDAVRQLERTALRHLQHQFTPAAEVPTRVARTRDGAGRRHLRPLTGTPQTSPTPIPGRASPYPHQPPRREPSAMDNQKLSPSAKLTLDALNTGPGNVHELSERTGRSRSTTDKAVNDLAKAGLVVKVDGGGDPADGAPARWQLAEAPADAETGQPEPDGDDTATEQDTDTPATGTTDADATNPAETAEPAADPQPDTEPPATATAGEAPADGGATPDGDGHTDTGDKPDGEAKPDGDEKKTEAQPPKLCRGCQAQMPKICECCWQKTPAYCGKCRKDMPQVQRGEPGEPVILSNGLPKLRPGELEDMVAKVMREQPLPAFAGIVGWTGGRLAIHIPGRSPGAMTNAMRKFTKDGKAELIGDDPERYQLKATGQQLPGGDTDNSQDTKPGTDDAPAQESPADAAQPPADADAPQPDAAA